jgi:hypothetical protein
MQTIYFHIGQTKTATTTIQAFLHKNRAWLSENGIFYPEVPSDHPLKTQHRFLINSMHENKDDFHEALSAWIYLCDQIRQSHFETIVISEEVFWHLFEQNNEKRIKAINWIRQQLNDFNVRIVCYLRRQDRWIESWYNQIVKTDVTYTSQLSIDEFVERYIKYGLFDYYAVLSDWAAAFGDDNIIIRRFEQNYFINSDIIKDFCSIFGITCFDRASFPDDLQVSLPNFACDFSSIFNRSRRANSFKRIMVRVLSEFTGDKTDRRRYLPFRLGREILDKYEPSNKLVASRFIKDGEDLFIDKILSGPEMDFPGISSADLSRIVVELFIEQQAQIRSLQKKLKTMERFLNIDKL